MAALCQKTSCFFTWSHGTYFASGISPVDFEQSKGEKSIRNKKVHSVISSITEKIVVIFFIRKIVTSRMKNNGTDLTNEICICLVRRGC
jgi:hypothetical protein